MTGGEISTGEAFRLGLIQVITEPGKQFARALELAEAIADQAPLGVQAARSISRTILCR